MKLALLVLIIGLWVALLISTRVGVCRWGWHPKRLYRFDFNDGCSDHVTCGKCGYKGMLDSNGDLF